MKKQSARIGVLSIAFSALFLFASSGTKAETQDGAKKDLVSALHLETASLLGPKDDSGERKNRDLTPLPTVFVPVQEGVHAFLDFASSPYRGLVQKDSRGDYRAVVGFHFRID